MNRSELERRVAERTGLASSAAKGTVDAVFDVIAEALANGDDARVSGFGVFGTRARPARTGRNPRTGERVAIAASTLPTFKPGKALRDVVNTRTGG
ncbi:MAG: HU family DNA-binding protein [Rhodospirillaceae bacterium]|nr:HU family DNA-binding protein [Rhodospirillaceae bacterium]MYI50850.1 HU family DNA-binding protein [Rhodospirillaceae bacterium]